VRHSDSYGRDGAQIPAGAREEFILQKKIIRLAFFGSFFGNEKRTKQNG